MIKKGEDRTRAILWCIADVDPDMPVIQALGYLRAIEAQVRNTENKQKQASATHLTKDSRPADLLRELSGVPRVVAAAKTGSQLDIIAQIADHVPAGTSKAVIRAAAKSLANLYSDSPTDVDYLLDGSAADPSPFVW